MPAPDDDPRELARKSDDGALDVGTSIFARIPLRSLLGGAVGVLVGTLRHAANERVDAR